MELIACFVEHVTIYHRSSRHGAYSRGSSVAFQGGGGNLDRQENAIKSDTPHCRRKPEIVQPLENQVRAHPIAVRNLSYGNARRQRLRAIRAFLVTRPDPLLQTPLPLHYIPFANPRRGP